MWWEGGECECECGGEVSVSVSAVGMSVSVVGNSGSRRTLNFLMCTMAFVFLSYLVLYRWPISKHICDFTAIVH